MSVLSGMLSLTGFVSNYRKVIAKILYIVIIRVLGTVHLFPETFKIIIQKPQKSTGKINRSVWHKSKPKLVYSYDYKNIIKHTYDAIKIHRQ